MGIGGMIGAGIFSILGVVGNIAGSAAWISFLFAGILALFCGHTYAKMGAAFPSAGGPVEFLIRGLGNNLLTGTLNVMLWMGYVIALALYASAFAGYAVSLMPDAAAPVAKPLLAVGVVAAFLAINVVGSRAVGQAEGLIVAIKLLILLGFIAVTAFYIQPALLSVSEWRPPNKIAFAVGTTFLAFEGFGLITNAAGEMKNPAKTLPRAIYTSIGVSLAIYLLVVITTFGNLPLDQIIEKKEYALAAAAEPALGQTGFTIIAVAALFSTASAINATLFGGANVSYLVANERQMPKFFDRQLWHGSKAGLYITAGLVAFLAATMPLSAIANTGSAAFLLVYAGVCAAHLRVRDKTHAAAWPIYIALMGCIVCFGLLMIYLIRDDRFSAIGIGVFLALSFLIELIYRRFRADVDTLDQIVEPVNE